MPKSQLSRIVNVPDDTIYADMVENLPDGSQLQAYRAGQDFTPYGQEFMKDADVFNDYIKNVAQKYGLVIQRSAKAQNPLSIFRRGQMPYGGKLEAIVYDTIAPRVYKGATGDSPFEVNFGRVAGETFTETQDVTQTNTLVDTQDTMFFQNLAQFHDFVLNKALALINGVVLDEFLMTKLTLSKSIADGIMSQTTAHGIKDLAKTLKRSVKKMQYFSRDFNARGFNQASLVKDLVVLVPIDRAVDLDVDFYSQLFNPENARTNVNIVEIDTFPDVWKYEKDHLITSDDVTNGFAGELSQGATAKEGDLAVPGAPDAVKVFDGSKVGAVILDRDALQVWDALPLTLSTISNPRDRYTNLFVNKKSYLMFIGGLNSQVIMYDEDADNNATMEATVDVSVEGSQVQAPAFSGAVGEVVTIPVGTEDSGKTITATFNGKKVTPGTTKVTLTNAENKLVYKYA